MRFLRVSVQVQPNKRNGPLKLECNGKKLLLDAGSLPWPKEEFAVVAYCKGSPFLEPLVWISPYVVKQVENGFSLENCSGRHLQLHHPKNVYQGFIHVAVCLESWTPELHWVVDDRGQQSIKEWLLVAQRLCLDRSITILIVKFIAE